MPRLILKFEDRVLNEYALGSDVTIGRLPDNVVVIDNAAVSGHHARVFLDGDQYVVEDLKSKNGTYVNERHVLRAALESGDVLLVGKHKLLFDESDAVESAAARPVAPSLDKTAYLDTMKHRALLARLREERARAEAEARAARNGWAVLRVLNGDTDQPEYALRAQTSFIGKSEVALVRLRGWFKPRAAAAIVRSGEGYELTPLRGRTLVNRQRLDRSHDLQDGDVVEVAGLMMEFRLNGPARDGSCTSPNQPQELTS